MKRLMLVAIGILGGCAMSSDDTLGRYQLGMVVYVGDVYEGGWIANNEDEGTCTFVSTSDAEDFTIPDGTCVCQYGDELCSVRQGCGWNQGACDQADNRL